MGRRSKPIPLPNVDLDELGARAKAVFEYEVRYERAREFFERLLSQPAVAPGELDAALKLLLHVAEGTKIRPLVLVYQYFAQSAAAGSVQCIDDEAR